MKKIILVLTIALLSCEKECNCGKIVNDNAQNYSVEIENQCTGNKKTFYLNESDWKTAYVGTNYCITNEKKW